MIQRHTRRKCCLCLRWMIESPTPSTPLRRGWQTIAPVKTVKLFATGADGPPGVSIVLAPVCAECIQSGKHHVQP